MVRAEVGNLANLKRILEERADQLSDDRRGGVMEAVDLLDRFIDEQALKASQVEEGGLLIPIRKCKTGVDLSAGDFSDLSKT